MKQENCSSSVAKIMMTFSSMVMCINSDNALAPREKKEKRSRTYGLEAEALSSIYFNQAQSHLRTARPPQKSNLLPIRLKHILLLVSLFVNLVFSCPYNSETNSLLIKPFKKIQNARKSPTKVLPPCLIPCLVPVQRLPRPSRSMYFGDVSETNASAARSN